MAPVCVTNIQELSLRTFANKKDSLIIHATDDWYDKIKTNQIDFFEKMRASAKENGLSSTVLKHGSLRSKLALRGPNLHVVAGHQKTQGRRVLHAHPSYIWGFWYLDTLGYYWTSSLTSQEFRASDIDEEKATWFFNGVSGHMVRNRISKLQQPDEVQTLPRAKVAIFTQQIEEFKRPIHFMTNLEMIEAAAELNEDLVYVKLHPVQDTQTTKRILDHCCKFKNVVVTKAHVFDIIDASEVIVSQNSAVGFEALMLRKPVITCARCDYHHASIVAKSINELKLGIKDAREHFETFPYESYLYWFLNQNMLEPQQDEFVSRVWRRLLTTAEW